MAGAMARIPMNHRILTWDNREIEFSDDKGINISDTIFGFLDEESEGSSVGSTSNNRYGANEMEDDENEDKEQSENIQDKSFWESQNQLLHDTLCRTSSIESKIRKITKEAIKEVQQKTGINGICICGRTVINNNNGCKNCLMKEVCRRLQDADFNNSAICKSKWRSSPDIPSGEHTFLDVIDNSNPKKEVRVVIELTFRTEFEMARASEEYNQLVKRLPEVFVGKIERLLSLIKILCLAAKKCMKEKKMHLAPWRKHRYMQAKWLKTCERTTFSIPLTTTYSSRRARPRASMLTVDLLENMPGLHLTAVEVV